MPLSTHKVIKMMVELSLDEMFKLYKLLATLEATLDAGMAIHPDTVEHEWLTTTTTGINCLLLDKGVKPYQYPAIVLP